MPACPASLHAAADSSSTINCLGQHNSPTNSAFIACRNSMTHHSTISSPAHVLPLLPRPPTLLLPPPPPTHTPHHPTVRELASRVQAASPIGQYAAPLAAVKLLVSIEPIAKALVGLPTFRPDLKAGTGRALQLPGSSWLGPCFSVSCYPDELIKAEPDVTQVRGVDTWVSGLCAHAGARVCVWWGGEYTSQEGCCLLLEASGLSKASHTWLSQGENQRPVSKEQQQACLSALA